MSLIPAHEINELHVAEIMPFLHVTRPIAGPVVLVRLVAQDLSFQILLALGRDAGELVPALFGHLGTRAAPAVDEQLPEVPLAVLDLGNLDDPAGPAVDFRLPPS
jgi:hypothetical protein